MPFLFPDTYHLPPTTYHRPPITYHLPPITYHLPPITYHLIAAFAPLRVFLSSQKRKTSFTPSSAAVVGDAMVLHPLLGGGRRGGPIFEFNLPTKRG